MQGNGGELAPARVIGADAVGTRQNTFGSASVLSHDLRRIPTARRASRLSAARAHHALRAGGILSNTRAMRRSVAPELPAADRRGASEENPHKVSDT